MVGKLITLPLRVGVRVTQMWVRAAGEAAGVAYDVATHLLERDGRAERPVTPATPATTAQRNASSRAARPAAAPSGTATPPDEAKPTGVATELQPLDPEPAHVSEEPELVEAFAEPGAEDGAGAEIHIQEPWKDYERSNARDVIARLTKATAAELAAVELYEGSHQKRQTILAAVDRELRKANGSGSPTQERNR